MSDERDDRWLEDRAEADPIDLAEVRASRALAETLEGGEPGDDPDLLEALRAAATVEATREVVLDSESKARIADELFGEPRRRRPWLAIAAGAAAACALLAVSVQLAGRPEGAGAQATAAVNPSEAALLREEAKVLLAALMPPGGSPAGRAEHLAREAALRLRGSPQGGPP
ncbi:MAG: hypothetical protein ACOX6T_07735 [Myxococcales bacterium]